jgi:hypothetical protein
MDALVLKRVDGCAHAAIVGAKRNGARKRRRRQTAGATKVRD